ncbi:cell surface A33 antigen-like [Poeciliopsis prolifica]|uniref:cell surface A33 antigen-like n=1 Tax=Poeciliopsis prolifica TaxID=188132 RepID=UPI0024135DDE|nr:cell surface A33 antigen-like [Poeciliopsis prolifica]
MERRTSTLVLLCVVWSAAAALQVDIPKDQYEFARGDNITLPCTFTSVISNPSQVTITWFAGDVVILTHYHPSGDTDINIEDRVSVDANINGGSGKADLKINSVTISDNNKYQCLVQIPRDKQGKISDTATLTVLVAPSKPICKIQGTASYGQNINLTCVSEEGSPPPTYKWNSYDVLNNPRAHEPRTTDKGGILSLYNITKETSGFYICISQNKIRSASCNLTVSVLPPSMNIGSTAAIIGAVAIGLVLLIIIIYCCCCRKKNEDKENYAMAPVGDEESVRNGEGEKSKHDDSSVNKAVNPRDNYEERSERNYDGRSDYDDRRSDYDDRRRDYDDRRSDYNDRRSDYDDRRSDYNDRRSDYDDRRRDYDDRRSDYDDRRSDYDDRRSKPSDRNERYDDDRRYDDERRSYDRRDPR